MSLKAISKFSVLLLLTIALLNPSISQAEILCDCYEVGKDKVISNSKKEVRFRGKLDCGNVSGGKENSKDYLFTLNKEHVLSKNIMENLQCGASEPDVSDRSDVPTKNMLTSSPSSLKAKNELQQEDKLLSSNDGNEMVGEAGFGAGVLMSSPKIEGSSIDYTNKTNVEKSGRGSNVNGNNVENANKNPSNDLTKSSDSNKNNLLGNKTTRQDLDGELLFPKQYNPNDDLSNAVEKGPFNQTKDVNQVTSTVDDDIKQAEAIANSTTMTPEEKQAYLYELLKKVEKENDSQQPDITTDKNSSDSNIEAGDIEKNGNKKPNDDFSAGYGKKESSSDADTKSTKSNTDNYWSGYVDTTLKAGNNRNLGRVDLFLPIAQDGESLLFADVRGVFDTDSNQEGNIGLGYRKLLEKMGHEFILGGYGFFDIRNTENGNQFMQGTFGAEMLTKNWDLRANYYLADGKEHEIEDDKLVLVRNGVKYDVMFGDMYEKSMSGFDVEIGRAIPKFEDLRVFLAYYSFFADDDAIEDIDGVRARADYSVYKDIVGLEYEYQNDNVRDDSHFGGLRVRYRFGGYANDENNKNKMSDVAKRMDNKIVRDVDIVTQDDKFVSRGQLMENGHEVSVLTLTQDTTGTYIDDNADEGDYIYAYNNIRVTDELTLKEYQKIIGQNQGLTILGQNLLEAKSGNKATFVGSTTSYGANIINLANGNVIDGIKLDGVLDNQLQRRSVNAIYGENVSDIIIRNSYIDTAEQGINIVSNDGSDHQNILINNNEFEDGLNVTAIRISSDNSSSLDSVSINGNEMLDTATSYAIHMLTNNQAEITNLSIDNNKISNEDSSGNSTGGIYFESIGGGAGGDKISASSISNNDITNIIDAIYLDSQGTSSIDIGSISNNDLFNNQTSINIQSGVSGNVSVDQIAYNNISATNDAAILSPFPGGDFVKGISIGGNSTIGEISYNDISINLDETINDERSGEAITILANFGNDIEIDSISNNIIDIRSTRANSSTFETNLANILAQSGGTLNIGDISNNVFYGDSNNRILNIEAQDTATNVIGNITGNKFVKGDLEITKASVTGISNNKFCHSINSQGNCIQNNSNQQSDPYYLNITDSDITSISGNDFYNGGGLTINNESSASNSMNLANISNNNFVGNNAGITVIHNANSNDTNTTSVNINNNNFTGNIVGISLDTVPYSGGTSGAGGLSASITDNNFSSNTTGIKIDNNNANYNSIDLGNGVNQSVLLPVSNPNNIGDNTNGGGNGVSVSN